MTDFEVGQRVRVREQYRREGDFVVATVDEIDTDGTIDVSVDGRDWGQWFCPLPDGTYEIEPVPDNDPAATRDTCKHCGEAIHQEMFEGHSFWIDDATGGDVCGWNGGNEPHEPRPVTLTVSRKDQPDREET